MAESFVNKGAAATTVLTPIYTCPTGKQALLLLCQGTNVDGTVTGALTVSWKDFSAGNVVINLVKDLAIPPKSAVGVIDGKLVLEAGDQLMVAADTDAVLELTISAIEIG